MLVDILNLQVVDFNRQTKDERTNTQNFKDTQAKWLNKIITLKLRALN